MKKLSRLRLLFIIYIIIKTAIDVAFLGNNRDVFQDMSAFGFGNVSVSPSTIFMLVLLVDILLFVIGLWLFFYLLRNRLWARIVLLIAGWLAVIDAISGLFLHPQTMRILTQMSSTTDWNKILFLDHLTDILGFIYFGYMIFVLQFDRDVRKGFSLPPPAQV